MSAGLAWSVLLAEAGVAAAAGWLLLRVFAPRSSSLWETALGWVWSGGLVVVSCALAAGSLGCLGAWGMAAGLAASVLVLAGVRRRELSSDGLQWLLFLRKGRAAVREERASVLCLVALLAWLTAIAAWARPGVFDALSYRLPRIAEWLQGGRVGSLPANDPRVNYMPVVPDLFMAWLMSGFREGFQPPILAQTHGGVLLCVGTFGLARLQGLSRRASLLSVMLLFGMASVTLQFTAADTDLFAAGQLVAAFTLWWAAARRGEASILAGLAGGLALSSKGTLFYLAPGALVWIAWVGWRERVRLGAWLTTSAAVMLSFAVFGLPGIARNLRDYGGPFGPAGFVRMHHGSTPAGQHLRKLGLNLRSSFAQLFDPHSQPPGFESAARGVGLAIARGLPSSDPFSYDGLDRRATLVDILERPAPDADKESLGVLAFGCLVAAALAAALGRRPGYGLVLAWSAGIAVFWVFFLGLQLWHPYGFRYYTLVAPWMAVCTAWWVESFPPVVRRPAWCVLLLLSAGVAWKATMQTPQSGWIAATEPELAGSYSVFSTWRQWAQALDEADQPLRPCLPYNSPVAAFYRLPGGRRVETQILPSDHRTAQDVLAGRGGWLIAPASLFAGNEGDVVARTLLPTGEAAGPFSLGAYRLKRPGEALPCVLYRKRRTLTHEGCTFQLIVRSWEGGKSGLRITNREAFGCHVTASDPGHQEELDLGPGASASVSLRVASRGLSEARVVAVAASPGGAPPRDVELEWAAAGP